MRRIPLGSLVQLCIGLACLGGFPSDVPSDVLPQPCYENTFYLLLGNGYHWRIPGETAYCPEWDWHTGTLAPWMAEEILRDMLEHIGPPGPYARIGTAEAIWPSLWVDQLNDWSYSPGGGRDGLPHATMWREVPEGPLTAALLGDGRDSGAYLNDLVLGPASALRMPLVFFLIGYNRSPQRWEANGYDPAIPLDLTAYLEMTHSNCMLYEDGRVSHSDDLDGVFEPWDYVEDPAWNGNGIVGTCLTLSRMLDPAVREGYVRRNYYQALEHVLTLEQRYPGVIAALTMDPEVEMNNVRFCVGESIATDFSEDALAEWGVWLQHAGIYDDQTGEYAGDGCPDNGGQGYPTLELFNQQTGSSFSTWSEVDPRSPLAGPGLLDMYLDGGDKDGFFSGIGDTSIQGWSEVMVDHFCDDLVGWAMDVLEPAGWDANRVFTHQIPGGFVDDAVDPGAPWGYEFRMNPLIAAQVTRGSCGVTGFREDTIHPALFGVLRDSLSGERNWGHFEWNPISHVLDPTGTSSNDYEFWTNAFDTTYSYGCHLVAAYRWWIPPEQEPWSSIRPYAQSFRVRGVPVDFEARLRASHDFIQSIRFQPFSKYNDGPGVTADYDPPPVGGVAGRCEGAGTVALQWSILIWPDIPQCYWYDPYVRPLWPGMSNVFGWPDFTMGRFEVYRDTVAMFQPGPDNLLATVSNRDSVYTDTTTSVEGWYYYKILARDNDGTVSASAQTIAMIPQIVLDPTSVTDTVAQGAILQDTVLVTNQGSFPLVVEAWLEEDGGAAPSWAAVSPQADTLLPGASSTLELSLGLGEPEAGDHAATLTLACNDPYHRFVEVPIELTVEGAAAGGLGPGSVALDVSVVPNPVANEAFFRIQGAAAEPTLFLYDATGQLVDKITLSVCGSGSASIRWKKPSSLGGGMYVWRLVSGRRAVAGRLVLAP
jgi:hypothetical protein